MNDSNLLSSETVGLTNVKGKHAICKIQDSQLKEFKKEFNSQWENNKTDLEKMLIEPLISKSVTLKNFFALKKVKNNDRTLNSRMHSSFDNAISSDQHFFPESTIEKSFKTIKSMNREISKKSMIMQRSKSHIFNSTLPASIDWPNEDINKAGKFKVFCKINNLQKKYKKQEIKCNSYFTTNHDPQYKRIVKSVIPAQQYLKKA